MSFENPEEITIFSSKKKDENKEIENEIIPMNLNYINEKMDQYYPEAIKEMYWKKISPLRLELSKINEYLKAKNKIKDIPTPDLEILNSMDEEKMIGGQNINYANLLQTYQNVINFYEMNGVPDDILENAKKLQGELKGKIKELENIKKVAENDPRAN